MKLLLLLLLAACGDDNRCPQTAPQDTAPASCVPGNYFYVQVWDPPPSSCIDDSRCLEKSLWFPGEHCDFPGTACEYFSVTMACGCDNIIRCVPGHDPFHPTGCDPQWSTDMARSD